VTPAAHDRRTITHPAHAQRCPTCGGPVGPYGLELLRVARSTRLRAVLLAGMSNTPDLPPVDEPVDPDLPVDPDDDDAV
jgi:hypothetical protein